MALGGSDLVKAFRRTGGVLIGHFSVNTMLLKWQRVKLAVFSDTDPAKA